jgi:8-oxo-dGTP diphosphatase
MTKTIDSQSTIKVCAAVVLHDDKILITLRPQDKKLGGFWEFPGGKIEVGETSEVALKRELKEELDIEVEIGELLETVHHSYDWGNVVILAYWCRWLGGEIKHLEVADHCWVAAGNLLDYDILAADQPIIQKIQEQLS